MKIERPVGGPSYFGPSHGQVIGNVDIRNTEKAVLGP